MNRFIKKNLFLVGVLGLSALGILILFILSVMQYIEMSKYITKTAEMRATNESLMRQRPPAVAGNIELVQKDIDGFTAAGNELKNYFGQPFYPAIKAFSNELNAGVKAAFAMEMRKIDPNFKALEAKARTDAKAVAELDKYVRSRFGENRSKFDEEKSKAPERLKRVYERVDQYYYMMANPQTPDTLHKKLREFWDREKATEGPREQMYRKFRAECGTPSAQANKFWTVEIWDAALEKFHTLAQKSTLEVIDERNLEEIFLASLGLPRNLGKQQLRLDAFARDMQNKVVELLSSKNDLSMMGVYFSAKAVPEVPTNKAFSDLAGVRPGAATAGGSSASGDGNTASQQTASDPADVIRHWEIIADLAKRILASNVNSIEQLSYSNMVGREENNCKFYTYTLGVGGSEKSIRDLLNLLNSAYKENRVYVIRRLSIKKQEDQVQDIIDVAQGILTDKGEDASKLSVKDDSGNPGESAAAKVIVAPPNYFKEEGKYPECVAGRSDKCFATIILDYVVYSGNILK